MASVKDYMISGILTIIGAGIFWYGFNRMHKYQLIQDIPTSKIRSMAIGLVEINGKIVPDKSLTSPFSHTKCAYYKYIIKEYRRHRSGKQTTYSWDTITSGEKRIPFWVKDETGKVYVNPEGAELKIPVKKVFLQKAGFFGTIGNLISTLNQFNTTQKNMIDTSKLNLTLLENNKTTFFNSVGDRKYFEYYLEPNEELYIIGTATNAPKVNIQIQKGENEPTFIISNNSEKTLINTLRLEMIGCFILGSILFVAGIIIILKLIGAI